MESLQDTQLEREVLGAALTKPEASYVMTDALSADHFTAQKHRVIYRAIADLQRRGHEPDLPNVTAFLRDKGQIESVGVRDLTDIACGPAISETYHIERLQQLYRARVAFTAFSRAVGELEQGADTVDDVIDETNKAIYDASCSKKIDRPQQIGSVVDGVIKEYERRYETGEAVGLPTKFAELNKYIQFCPGEMTVIQARPAMGKTAFSMQLAKNFAEQGFKTMFFSLEMGNESLAGRLLSCSAQVGSMRQKVTLEALTAVKSAAEGLRDLPLILCDSPVTNVTSIGAKMRMQQLSGGLDIVFIDYLQLIATGGTRPSDNRTIEVGEISRQLKLMTKRFNVPIVALSQMSRAVENRQDKRPKLFDLRESGSIEQDADIVLGLYRDEKYNPETEDRGKCEIIINKNRHGDTGTVYLGYVEGTLTFYGLDPQDEQFYPGRVARYTGAHDTKEYYGG